MALEITGKLHKLFETQTVTERFNKREFVVQLPGRHPQLVLFQLTGKRCAELDAFNPGDEVAIQFSLRGREWTSRQGEVRFFNSLEVTRIERLAASSQTSEASPPALDDDDEPPF
jgi:single-strand DNA-binding protein